MARPFRENLALGGGYTLVLGLLICSTIEAYRLQRTLSMREAAVYQSHIERENALSELRDLMWLGATYAREYLIDGDAVRFRSQIAEITQKGKVSAALLRPEAAHSFFVYTEAWSKLAAASPGGRELTMSLIEKELLPLRLGVLETLEQTKADIQNELRSAEGDLAKTQLAIVWQLFIVLGSSLLAGLAIAGVTMRYVRNWQLERTEHAVEMAHLSARLQDVQEEERKSLAHELHDEVGQTLTALRMEISPALAASQNPAVRERLRHSYALAERALQTVRHISLMLRPSLLDDLGLDAALEWHLKEFSRRSGIQTEYLSDEGMMELSDETRTCIYRVAQEALNNCEKYSRALKVRVVVRSSEDSIMVEISDNGIGFHLNSRGMPAGGTGLLGIRERVSRLGGAALVDTSPGGGGTRVLATLPLTATERKRESASVA